MRHNWVVRAAAAVALAGVLPVRSLGAFTDDPVSPDNTKLRAVHFQELRNQIDLFRKGRSLPPYPWADNPITPSVTRVRGEHIAQLRAAISQLLALCGQAKPNFSDPVITPDVTGIRAVHLKEVRDAVSKYKNKCQGGWYQAPYNTAKCTDFCKTLGKGSAPGPEGLDCMAGEMRPLSAVQAGIKTVHGCWGACPWGFTGYKKPSFQTFCGSCDNGPCGTLPGSFWACWHQGQKQDCDATDAVVGCYCQ